MFLVIDNYDSFVHNLARYLARAGANTQVVRNDALSVADIRRMQPAALVLSPGPGAPPDAGICVEAVRKLGAELPILGVCLGHQAISEAYGGQTVRASRPVHGKATAVTHDGTGLFEGLPSPMQAGRYHSLIAAPPPACRLAATAHTAAGEIMALQHPLHPVCGVQFHPESVLTEHGQRLIENFVAIVRQWHKLGKNAA